MTYKLDGIPSDTLSTDIEHVRRFKTQDGSTIDKSSSTASTDSNDNNSTVDSNDTLTATYTTDSNDDNSQVTTDSNDDNSVDDNSVTNPEPAP